MPWRGSPRDRMTARGHEWFQLSARLLRHPVNFFADELLLESSPLENPLGVLDHHRVAAQIRRCGFGCETHPVKVLAQDVLGAPHFPSPSTVFPGAADGGNVLEPRERG